MLNAHGALAVPEQELAVRLRKDILPFFATGESYHFRGVNDVQLAYRSFIKGPESPAIVIAVGRGEHQGKYAELAYDLFHTGYSVYLLDPRGQGASDRLIRDSNVGHLDFFEAYAEDLISFSRRIVSRRHSKLFLLAHSVGATAGILAMQSDPSLFDAAALITPMLDFDQGLLKRCATAAIVNLRCIFGLADLPVANYVNSNEIPFEINKATSSRARYAMMAELREHFNRWEVGAPSWGWVREALRGQSLARDAAASIKTPTLMWVAEYDSVVSTAASLQSAALIPRCEVNLAGGAKHALLFESDLIRERVLKSVLSFFESNSDRL